VWMPFLVLRTGDWVRPVRDRARAGLVLVLADRPQTCLPAVLGMALPHDTLLSLAKSEPDVGFRARLAELMCQQAVWRRRTDTLHRLAHHPGRRYERQR
jgi:hypothetical protein